MVHVDPAASRRLVQGAIQIRAFDCVSRGAVGEDAPDRDRAQVLARAAHEVDGPRGKTQSHDRPLKIERPQRIKPVDGDRQERSRVCRALGVGFIHNRLDAGALQCHGGDGPSDAAADDECLCHSASPVDQSFLSVGSALNNLRGVFDRPATNTFLVKPSHWFNR